MKRKYPKIYYFWWVLLGLWAFLLVFALLVSFHVIPWYNEITALQYILCGTGLFTSAVNIRFWRKKDDE